MFKFLSRKQSPVWGVTVMGKDGIAAWSKFNQKAAAEVYTRVDVAFSCIDMISAGCTQANFKAVRTLRDGTKQEIFDHPFVKILKRPSPRMSFDELIYSYAAWKLITGNTYLYINNGEKTDNYKLPPTEINVLPADRMKIVPSRYGVLKYVYTANGIDKELPVDQVSQASNVIHSRFFNPADDFYGLSPMQAAARNIDIYESALKWNRSLLHNSCCPSGMFIWTGEGVMDEEQRKQMKLMLENHTGTENSGKPLIGGGKIDFKQIALSPKDADFLAAKTMTMKDIARVYRVSPILLNIGGDATFSNMAEARLSLWDEVIIPTLECFCGEINSFIMPRYGQDDVKIELDLTAVTALEPRRESQWNRAKTADFLTINERRNIVGYADIDGGDELLVPASSVPLSYAASDISDLMPADDGSDDSGKKKRPHGMSIRF